MDDLIRRQAVKDILFNKRGVRIYTHKGEKLKRYAEIDLDDFDAIPSAQPEPEAISEWKKEFREYVDSLDIARDDWKGIIEYIDELPSIQPDVIRCKDCANYIDHRCVVADHHVAPFSCCQDVFNARRRGEQE